MNKSNLTLFVINESFAICKLPSGFPIPPWAMEADFFSLTKTPDELSIVCMEKFIPVDVIAEKDLAAIKVLGQLDFSMIGILSTITTILAGAGISVFAISTFDTDYIFVKNNKLSEAIEALSNYFTIAC